MTRSVLVLTLLLGCHGATTSQPTTSAAPVTNNPTPPPSTPTGTLRLEGQILGADDAPVAGATVTLSPTGRTTTSEADGAFAFDGLVAGSYEVTARDAEGRAGAAHAKLTATSEPVLLRLRDGSEVP